MDSKALYQLYKKHSHVSTDTRSIRSGSLFFALKGTNFNGNRFAEEALKKGASYAIIDEKEYKKDDRYLLVDNVLHTLQGLAKHHRSQLSIPIIGITGTNGKTTSKELLNAVLKQKYQCYATKGNLNNHIGVPLSVLEITDKTDIAIIEMGANHPKEIALLCSIAQPTHGLITNVGKAHLEGFGGFEGVKKSKAELYEYLSEHQGTLFIQGDNDDLKEMMGTKTFREITTYGSSSKNEVYGKVVEVNPFLSIVWRKAGVAHQTNTQITGAYNLENILAAIAVGSYFDIDASLINKGLADYIPRNNRSQFLITENNRLICDYYNANVSSMLAALENFSQLNSEHKKVLILGDMYELGEESAYEHQNIVERALQVPADKYIFVGKDFYARRLEMTNTYFFTTTADALDALQKKPLLDSIILLKASRGMAFEKLIEVL